MTVLSTTTSLFRVLVRELLHRARDRFSICNARPTYIGLNPKLSKHAVNQYIEVQFAHPGNNRLPGILIRADTEGRILFGQLAERFAHLILIRCALWFDRDRNDRLREGDAFQYYLLVVT